MSERAQVTSSEAIEFFRSNLIAYLAKARPLLEDASDEVFRTREWLENDRRVHWENQVKRRTRVLQEAQQALLGAKMSNLRDARSSEQLAVMRAKQALREAEEKLRLTKRWSSEFEHRSQVLVKDLEHLRAILATEMPKAVAHLWQIVQRVEAYATIGAMPPGMDPNATPEKKDGEGKGE